MSGASETTLVTVVPCSAIGKCQKGSGDGGGSSQNEASPSVSKQNMGFVNPLQKIEELLTCPICLDRYKQPKLLPCQHTFCLPCLDSYADTVLRNLKCPECRAEHAIPYDGVKSFPANYTLTGFLDIHLEASDENSEELAAYIQRYNLERCRICDEKAELEVCPHCERRACAECRGNHMEMVKRDLGRLLNQVKRLANRVKDAASSINKSIDLLTMNTETTKTEVQEYFHRYYRELKRREENFMADIDTFHETELRLMKSLKDVLDVESGNIQDACGWVESVINGSKEAKEDEIFKMKNVFVEGLEYLRNFQPDAEELFGKKIRFSPGDDASKLPAAISSFGELSISMPQFSGRYMPMEQQYLPKPFRIGLESDSFKISKRTELEEAGTGSGRSASSRYSKNTDEDAGLARYRRRTQLEEEARNRLRVGTDSGRSSPLNGFGSSGHSSPWRSPLATETEHQNGDGSSEAQNGVKAPCAGARARKNSKEKEPAKETKGTNPRKVNGSPQRKLKKDKKESSFEASAQNSERSTTSAAVIPSPWPESSTSQGSPSKTDTIPAPAAAKSEVMTPKKEEPTLTKPPETPKTVPSAVATTTPTVTTTSAATATTLSTTPTVTTTTTAQNSVMSTSQTSNPASLPPSHRKPPLPRQPSSTEDPVLNDKIETIRQAHEERIRQRLNSFSAITSGDEENHSPSRASFVTRIEKVPAESNNSPNEAGKTTQRFRILCRSSPRRQTSIPDTDSSDEKSKKDHEFQSIPIEHFPGETSSSSRIESASSSRMDAASPTSWMERRRMRYQRSRTSPDILRSLVESSAAAGTPSPYSARLQELLAERERRLENSTMVRYVPLPRQDSSEASASASASATESESSANPIVLPSERRSRFRRRSSIVPDRELSIDRSPIRSSPRRSIRSSPGFSIIDYSAKSTPKSVFGKKGEKPAELNWPRGIAVMPGGEFAVADSSNHRIQIFNSSGRSIKHFGVYGTEDGELDSCAGVAYHRYKQWIVVSDRYNHRIQMFDLDGKYVKQFGGLGVADGKFNNPWGVCVNEMGLIYVVDKDNHRVQIFDQNGNFMSKFGSGPGDGIGQFNHPLFITIHKRSQNIYVSDSANHRICVFDQDGSPIMSFGIEGFHTGQLKLPRGVAVDDQGYVIVADSGNNRVQVFSPDGKFYHGFGAWGSNPGQLKGIEAVALMDNQIIVSDRENHRIQLF